MSKICGLFFIVFFGLAVRLSAQTEANAFVRDDGWSLISNEGLRIKDFNYLIVYLTGIEPIYMNVNDFFILH